MLGWHRLKGLVRRENPWNGYRAKYLVDTARHLEKTLNFTLGKITHSQARLKLMELRGWAESGRLCTAFWWTKNQAFPIDTWILQS